MSFFPRIALLVGLCQRTAGGTARSAAHRRGGRLSGAALALMLMPMLALSLASPRARAAEVAVIGLFPGKAVLVVDGGTPRAYAAGAQVTEQVRLVSVQDDGATLEIAGKRQFIAMGQHMNASAPSAAQGAALTADGQGHFWVNGEINGRGVRMLVDTGATLVSMNAEDARRFGIDYRKGQPGMSSTANGMKRIWVVKLDRIRVGDIELYQIDAAVSEGDQRTLLLGMSFLNRVDMHREGSTMRLTRRY